MTAAARPHIGVIPAILAAGGVLLATIGLLSWLLTHRVVDGDAFSEATVTALRTPEGRRLISDEVTRQVDLAARQRGVSIPPQVAAGLVPQAVDEVVSSQRFGELLTPTIRQAHVNLLEDPTRPIVVDLEPLRPTIVAAVPQLAAYLPREGALGAFRVTPADRAPVLVDAARAVDSARVLPAIAGGLAVGLMVVALAISRARRRLARRTGIALAIVAGACVAIGALGPSTARGFVADEPGRSFTKSFATELLGGYWLAALAAAVVSAALVAGGGLRGRPART